jgi:hypothetical protein
MNRITSSTLNHCIYRTHNHSKDFDCLPLNLVFYLYSPTTRISVNQIIYSIWPFDINDKTPFCAGLLYGREAINDNVFDGSEPPTEFFKRLYGVHAITSYGLHCIRFDTPIVLQPKETFGVILSSQFITTPLPQNDANNSRILGYSLAVHGSTFIE